MARVKKTSAPGRASAKEKTSTRTKVPDIYNEMLADTVASASQINDEGKIVKRRRVAGRMVVQSPGKATTDNGSGADEIEYEELTRNPESTTQQTTYNESDDSSEIDLNWEEVDLQESFVEDNNSGQHDNQNDELSLVLNQDTGATRGHGKNRKVPITAAERQLRVDTHKMHLLCLLVHIHIRNHWCNDGKVHSTLKGLLSDRTFSYLNPDEKQSQFQRSRSFIDGLRQSSETFRAKFKITSRGMRRSMWAENSDALANIYLPEDLELPMQKSDFRDAATKLEASRDTGAQLFCALLRSIGVEARLVCSLQALPLSVTAAPRTSQRQGPAFTIPQAERHSAINGDDSCEDERQDLSSAAPTRFGPLGRRTRFTRGIQTRLNGTLHSSSVERRSITPPKTNTNRIKESQYPIFWAEAFNEADQKWIPVDPLVTKTVSKPSQFEPPASDPQNCLTYVVAFETDGSARDVTRRYAKAFNAKTRRGRLEAVKAGEVWWRRVMKMYKRAYDLPRDQIEDSELAAREAAEQMPKNVLDFKDHPHYALERHLKRGEVIHPKREVGKVAAGRSGGNQILEPIFRRKDVHVVKSGDSWYRMGREIKIGEQPLKHVPSRRAKEPVEDDDDARREDNAGTALYSYDQTKQYSAPPVVDGRVPKNVYGNLDIYVPSMVPAGGVHIPHPETSRAARLLGVDYADAVTGFAFKGRHGTAIITGAVVAESCRDAVEEVIRALETEKEEEEETRRVLESLRMWKRFLAGLRIRERIQGYEIEGERNIADETIRDDERGTHDENGGGFFQNNPETSHSKRVSDDDPGQPQASYDEDRSGGFVLDNIGNDENGGGFVPNDAEDDSYGGGFVPNDAGDDSYGGVFVPNDAEDDSYGGGFVLNDMEDDGDGATFGKHETNDLIHQMPPRLDDQDQESSLVHDRRMPRVEEIKAKSNKNRSLFQKVDQINLSTDEDVQDTIQESHSVRSEIDRLQAPFIHSRRSYNNVESTAMTSRADGNPSHKENRSITSSDYLSQTQKLTDFNIPLTPSKPYLSDFEMAEALALQRIHDSGYSKITQSLSPIDQETNIQPSHISPSTSACHGSASISTLNKPVLASSAQIHSLEIQTDPEVGIVNMNSPPQERKNEVEINRQVDDDESEDAGSLLSRDPSDEEADLGWMD